MRRFCAGALLALLFATPSAGQLRSRRPAGDEWNQVRPLFALVEQVAAGAPAPADVEVAWQCHFFDADAGVVLVPFILDIRRGAFTSFPIAMYVRVVPRGAPAPRPGPKDALAQYPFEDAAMVDGVLSDRISRAFTAPPGAYDVYIGLRERAASGTESTVRPKTVVVKQEVTVPDLKSGLNTSSVIVADRVEPDTGGGRATYEQQLDDPYRLFGLRITPATRRTFAPDETLSVMFLVYQATVATDDKPDVAVAYRIHRSAAEAADSLVATIRSEEFNSNTLPATFSLTGGDLILAGRQIPLPILSPGAYRLEILVTDKTAGTMVRRIVPFFMSEPAPR